MTSRRAETCTRLIPRVEPKIDPRFNPRADDAERRPPDHGDDESLFPALQAGARGYLTKDASAEEIEQAIRAVAAGRTHLEPAVRQRLVDAALDWAEVLKLIASGLSNAEIAATLVVSNATVKTHVHHILAKTGARDRAQAVRYALRHGFG